MDVPPKGLEKRPARTICNLGTVQYRSPHYIEIEDEGNARTIAAIKGKDTQPVITRGPAKVIKKNALRTTIKFDGVDRYWIEELLNLENKPDIQT